MSNLTELIEKEKDPYVLREAFEQLAKMVPVAALAFCYNREKNRLVRHQTLKLKDALNYGYEGYTLEDCNENFISGAKDNMNFRKYLNEEVLVESVETEHDYYLGRDCCVVTLSLTDPNIDLRK